MSTKFHIAADGNPKPCTATEGNCPLGGDDSHFSTREEARAAYEQTQPSLFDYATFSNEAQRPSFPGSTRNEVANQLYDEGYDRQSVHVALDELTNEAEEPEHGLGFTEEDIQTVRDIIADWDADLAMVEEEENRAADPVFTGSYGFEKSYSELVRVEREPDGTGTVWLSPSSYMVEEPEQREQFLDLLEADGVDRDAISRYLVPSPSTRLPGAGDLSVKVLVPVSDEAIEDYKRAESFVDEESRKLEQNAPSPENTRVYEGAVARDRAEREEDDAWRRQIRGYRPKIAASMHLPGENGAYARRTIGNMSEEELERGREAVQSGLEIAARRGYSPEDSWLHVSNQIALSSQDAAAAHANKQREEEDRNRAARGLPPNYREL